MVLYVLCVSVGYAAAIFGTLAAVETGPQVTAAVSCVGRADSLVLGVHTFSIKNTKSDIQNMKSDYSSNIMAGRKTQVQDVVLCDS